MYKNYYWKKTNNVGICWYIINCIINIIDETANKYLNKWTIDRLGHTDQSILRLGIYELLYTDTPAIVVINEAVDLAKSFSDDDVRKMINGVLDKVYHEKENNEQ